MNNIKRIPSLLIFAEVANQRSFTQAAKKLGMSKSAVSQQVKRLEEDIGQQLLSRNTRGMSLTATGERLLDRCELLRDHADLAFEELNHSKEMPSGTFAITFSHPPEKDIIIPALKQLCLEFPKIKPVILVTDEPLDLIQNNLDVAIYAGELKDSNYRALPIGTASEVFCATPRYIQKQGLLTVPNDLLKHRFIATAWQKSIVPVFKNDALAEKISVTLDFFAKTNTQPCTLDMVLLDMGIASLPEYTIQTALTNGQLVRALPDYQGRQWPFYLVHRFQGEKPIHISRFYQLVKHFFNKASANS